MVTAIVLINAERERIRQTAEQLAELPGMAEVYSVAGPYDLVAIIRVSGNDELAEVVADRMREVNGVAKTTTLVAFRAYSRHDLDRMFGIGLEGDS